MDPPNNNADYRRQEYWDSRYHTEDSYDWFSGYASFRHLLTRDVDKSSSILMLGSGNSPLSEQMYKDGFIHVTNIDFSPVVINKMAEKHADLPEMTWRVMDITDLTFNPGSFDVVIEKGTIDALMVHEKDPWHTSVATCNQIDTILTQVSTILKPGGKFISITFAQPHFRRPMYARARYNWDVNLDTFGNTFHFFYFLMKTGEQLNDKDRNNEIEREKQKMIDQDSISNTVFLEESDSEDFLLGLES